MPKCFHCKRKCPLVIPCAMCKESFCTGHLMLEIHACPNMILKVQTEKDILTKRLGNTIYSKASLLQDNK